VRQPATTATATITAAGKTRWASLLRMGRNRASVAFNCSESGSRANAAAHTLRAWL